MGRQVEVPLFSQRVMSLVPSQTELLIDLGLGDRLVGRTKFCIHPAAQVNEVPIVGGTKKLHIDRIADLKPDLIIGNKEENDEDQIRELATRFPIWMSDVYHLDDAIEMIRSIGKLVQLDKQAESLANDIRSSFKKLDGLMYGRVAYLIWESPMMAVGPNTFIHDMLNRLGLTNAVEEVRYPELSNDELCALHPDYLFLSSEPFPYKEKHIRRYNEVLPDAKIMLVDGEMFSWYGSRLLKSVDYFRQLKSSLY